MSHHLLLELKKNHLLLETDVQRKLVFESKILHLLDTTIIQLIYGQVPTGRGFLHQLIKLTD